MSNDKRYTAGQRIMLVFAGLMMLAGAAFALGAIVAGIIWLRDNAPEFLWFLGGMALLFLGATLGQLAGSKE